MVYDTRINKWTNTSIYKFIMTSIESHAHMLRLWGCQMLETDTKWAKISQIHKSG